MKSEEHAIKELVTKLGNIFESSDLVKAQYLNFVSSLVSVYILSILFLTAEGRLNKEYSYIVSIFVGIYTLYSLLVGSLGFYLNKTHNTHTWYIHLSTISYSIANAIVLYYLGIFSLGSGVILVGGPISGMLVFERRTAILSAVGVGLILSIILVYLTINQYIAYAPIIDDISTAHANIAWLLVMSGLAIPNGASLIYTSVVSINRWKEREQRIRYLSSTDVMTQVSNRRHLMEQFEIELDRARREESPLSVLMVDLDNFKSINDRYGHQVGDEALRTAAAIFKNAIRKTDHVGRYGGEEFCILLPGANEAAALKTAERCRHDLEQAELSSGSQPIRITASFGMSHIDHHYFDNECANIDEILRAADLALYDAKQQGRNCVASRAV